MNLVDRLEPYRPPRSARPAERIAGAWGAVSQFVGFGLILAALVLLHLETILAGHLAWYGILSGVAGAILLLVGCVPTIQEIRTRLRELDAILAEIRTGGPT